MAEKPSRGGTRRRSTSTGRVDAPKGKAQWMDDPNAPINNVDPNAVYVAPDASGADNNHIDPNAVYVAPSVSGSSGVTRPGNSNTVTRPTSSGSPSRPSTGNTVTRPTTSTVVVKPLVDKTVIQNLLYIKVVDGGKRAEEVVAPDLFEGFRVMSVSDSTFDELGLHLVNDVLLLLAHRLTESIRLASGEVSQQA